MEISRNFMISFASVNLNIRISGHLLCRIYPIRMYDSPVTRLLCNLCFLFLLCKENSICISCSGSVNTGWYINGNWFFEFSPELMHAVHVLHSSLMCFSSRTATICCPRPAFLSSWDVQNVMRLPLVSSAPRHQN